MAPTTEMKRRTFLRGLGVSIALPAFESIGKPIGKSGKAKRFVCIAPNYGMYPGGFFPEQIGLDYVMPSLLKSLEPHRKDLSIFTNLDHPDVGGGHGCSNTFLNGVELKDTKDNPQRLFSFDQHLAEQIGEANRFPSLLLGAGGFSWSRAGVKLPTNSDPRKIFAQLFLDDPRKTKERNRHFIDEDASILDVVREDARRLSQRLTKTDRDKLDEYLTSVRAVERHLRRKEEWIDIRKPKVKDSVIKGDGDDRIVDLSYPYNTEVLYDLMVLALQTDSSKVICYGHPGGNRLFPFDGITLGYHSLTHHGKRPDLLKQLVVIESYYAQQFSNFLTKLKNTRDVEDRPLLDSTVVLFGSGMGNASSHSSRNLPIMLAGGGFRHGQHHRFERHGRDGLPLSNLFVSIMQQLKIEQDRFATSTGNLNHLLT
tara:strand:+ start:1746 stop:3023 length:1278 start_codon:yes stop_codon:yes gene_type:complete